MDKGLKLLSDLTIFQLDCPLCKKQRIYKTKNGFEKAKKFKKLCKSCSNSIANGGKGCLIKDNQKICSFCHIYKNFEEFSQTGKKLKSRCKNCETIYSKKYAKDILRFNRYNISKNVFEDFLSKQNYKCAICFSNIVESSCHIDHCHQNNQVRGLLCELCNKGLGQFKDSIINLKNAIKYLNNNK